MRNRRGITLLECIVVSVVGIGLVYFMYHSMMIARQRAVAGHFAELGARSEVEEDRTVRMLDLSNIPEHEIKLEQLEMLSNLRSLNLDHTQTTDENIERLSHAFDLEQAYLVGTSITDKGIKSIASWDGLRFLDLRATLITDEAMKDLAQLKELRELRLSQTLITNIGLKLLANHKNLKVLDLRFTHFDDDGIETLLTIPNLERVRLTGSRITAAGIKKLRKARRHLAMGWEPLSDRWYSYRIQLWATKVVSSGPLGKAPSDENPKKPVYNNVEQPIIDRLQAAHAKIEFASNLVHRVTFNNRKELTNDVLKDIHKLRNLQQLIVEGSPKFTGESLDNLRSCWNIRYASFKSTGLNDKGLEHVAHLRSASSLRVEFNKNISDAALAAFGQARALEWLYIANTPITDRGLELFSKHTETTNFNYIDLVGTKVTAKGLVKLKRKFSAVRPHTSRSLQKKFNQLRSR